jgi:N-acetyl-anhydromuramyl-L-alanine amidase AmpD
MFYLSTIIAIFVRKIILIFCFTTICFCAKTIDAVERYQKETHSVKKGDFEKALEKANLTYEVTDVSGLGPVHTVTPKFGSPHCHIFDPSNTKQVGPNDSREERPITHIIMHHTECDFSETLRLFSNGEIPFVNAHYIVTETGEIVKMVDPKYYVARHAGVSKFREKEAYNRFSIGIEMINRGFETNGDKENEDKIGNMTRLIEYPEAQIQSVFKLLNHLWYTFGIKENILAHGDVAPNRKRDTTSQFPWRALYEKYGLGMGVSDDQIREAEQILDQRVCLLHSKCKKRCFDRTFYGLLQCFGYDVPENAASQDINAYKNDRVNPVMAFLSHFSRNGQDIETLREPLTFLDLCHLYALCKKYPTENNQNIDALIPSCE